MHAKTYDKSRALDDHAAACPRCGEPVAVPAFLAACGTLCDTCRRAVAAEREATDRAAAQARREQAERQRAEALAAVRADLPGALAARGVPRRFLGAAFDTCPDLPRPLVEAIRAWAGDPHGSLVLHGPPGAGKTWGAAAALRHTLAAGILAPAQVAFIREAAYLDAVKAGFDRGARADRARRGAHAVRLLVVDDLAASYATDWSRAEVAALVEARHAACLATVVTTNLPGLAAVAEAIDGRTASRLAEGGRVLKFPDRDLRLRR